VPLEIMHRAAPCRNVPVTFTLDLTKTTALFMPTERSANRVVRTGTWLYDGIVERPVDVIALDFDWWYELSKADDMLESGEEPLPLGPEGVLYYVRFQRAGQPVLPTTVDTPGFASVNCALEAAEGKVRGGIRWDSK